ncbi:MAG: ACT domain-containing protein [Clostridia bacterium]|nr:ACT domain-containing protein [Clostridia bacterium]
MRAVITVIGKDMVGILAKVSTKCAESGMNITDVTQSILQDMFVMVMMIDIKESSVPFADFSREMSEMGRELGLDIRVMHEDIFNSMHHV